MGNLLERKFFVEFEPNLNPIPTIELLGEFEPNLNPIPTIEQHGEFEQSSR